MKSIKNIWHDSQKDASAHSNELITACREGMSYFKGKLMIFLQKNLQNNGDTNYRIDAEEIIKLSNAYINLKEIERIETLSMNVSKDVEECCKDEINKKSYNWSTEKGSYEKSN